MRRIGKVLLVVSWLLLATFAIFMVAWMIWLPTVRHRISKDWPANHHVITAGPNKGRQGVAGVAWHGFTVTVNAKPTYDEILDKWEVAQKDNRWYGVSWRAFLRNGVGRSWPTAWPWQVKRLDPQPTREEHWADIDKWIEYIEKLEEP